MDWQKRRTELMTELERVVKLRNELSEQALRVEGAILLCDEAIKQEQEQEAEDAPAARPA